MSADFLVEIGTEELPPGALLTLSRAFAGEIRQRLEARELDMGAVEPFATPRRLAVRVRELAEQTPRKEKVNWGPPTRIAFDSEGSLTKAGQAFARKNDLDPGQLPGLVENDGTQDKLCLRTVEEGVATRTLLADIVRAALAALPIPKRMRWGSRREEFVRPVHWVVMLLGEQVIRDPVMGLTPAGESRGHRFHSQGPIPIQSPGSYEADLRDACVIADFEERRALIEQGVRQAAQARNGHAVIDPDLLEEVTALNEWPVPLTGRFDEQFLAVPPEALISSMKEHQKYFHLVNDSDNLLPLFIAVANIESREPEQVVAGNEKVIRPRLSDAVFFYDADRRQSLVQRREQLRAIVFQEKLGTIFDKTERIAALGGQLVPAVDAEPEAVARAGQLCKSDLVSEMVLEFDDLQGVMGRYYARHDGEADAVAEAMFEHYLPRFAGDVLPETPTGTAIALADRLDTLVGIFGIGQPPSGSRDPFALRRASLGILRILVEKRIDLALTPVLEEAANLHKGLTHRERVSEQVLTYLFERFRAWYEDEGISPAVFMAVQAKALDNPLDFHLRVEAVDRFSKRPEAAALAAANKRVSNILSKAADTIPEKVETALFDSVEEQSLLENLRQVSDRTDPLLAARDYSAAMQIMATLKEPVDAFFDQVMVMADDDRVRRNRLALLTELRNLFLDVADISLLVPAS